MTYRKYIEHINMKISETNRIPKSMYYIKKFYIKMAEILKQEDRSPGFIPNM